MSQLTRAAAALAAAGWPVFPVRERGKLPLTEHGFRDASREWEQVMRWWLRWPDANIGVPMGAVVANVFVLDVDGPEARERLAELEREHVPLPATLTVSTGRGDGGEHRWFRADRAVASTKVRLGHPKLEIKGEGGYVIVPPSIHPSGAHYKWTSKLPPAKAPDWLVALLTKQVHVSRPTLPPSPVAGALSSYGAAALDRECDDVAATAEGSRNHRLFRAAAALGELVAGGELDEQLVRDRLAFAAAVCGLSATEAALTIASGLRRGFLTPRRAPERSKA